MRGAPLAEAQLVVNQKPAATLGFTRPRALLARADQVPR
jgi:hypothetical protein